MSWLLVLELRVGPRLRDGGFHAAAIPSGGEKVQWELPCSGLRGFGSGREPSWKSRGGELKKNGRRAAAASHLRPFQRKIWRARGWAVTGPCQYKWVPECWYCLRLMTGTVRYRLRPPCARSIGGIDHAMVRRKTWGRQRRRHSQQSRSTVRRPLMALDRSTKSTAIGWYCERSTPAAELSG